MLLDNPASGDARVLREARALAEAGHEVCIFARREAGFAAQERVEGIAVRRFWPEVPIAPRLLVRWALAARSAGILPWLAKLAVFGLLLPPALLLRAAPGLRARLHDRDDRPLFAPPPPPGTGRDRGGLALLLLALGKAYRNTFVFPALEGAAAAWRPDVVHAHEIPMLPAGADVARTCGARLVYDAHELHQHTHPPRPPVLAFWFRLHERRAARFADQVITVSPSIASWLQKDLALGHRPVVVLNAPIIEKSDDSGRRLRDDVALGPGEILAVYVGRVRAGRGLEGAVEALSHAPSVHLVVLGPREAEFDRRLLALAAGLGCARRLHLREPVPHAVLVEKLRGSDCGVLAIEPVCLSYEFCLPNKLFETVFANVPVAASDLVELRRFITAEQVGCLMDPDDPKDIARALLEAARHPYGGDEARCRALVERYAWPAQAEVLRRLYDDLVPAGTPLA